MVLIRIPNNMELFEGKNMSERVGDGIRSRLLCDSIDDALVEAQNHATDKDGNYDAMKNF